MEAPAERWDVATDMTLTLIRCVAMSAGWKFDNVRPGMPRMLGDAAGRNFSLKDRGP
jgi:hypothetical protein